MIYSIFYSLYCYALNGESICFFFWILISFLILRSLLCIAKNWICYWSLMVIYNCECSLSCILYKANVWTFDSCHNSVYGLSEKKDLLKLCGWCCAFSSLGKWLETNINQNVKAPSIHHTVWCYDQHEWGLLFCVVLHFWYSDWLWHQDNLIFCCFSTNFRP